MMEHSITSEAHAFDHQILERVANGHIPDFRRMAFCPYFYNNVWREPDYVGMHLLEIFNKILKIIKDNITRDATGGLRILEVGCGPGYVSLELARNGHSVTGIDISPECIGVAQRFADEDPFAADRGALFYRVADFYDFSEAPYDLILFFSSLHHFRNVERVVAHAADLLKDEGVIVAYEPARDRMNQRSAAMVLLIETLLSSTNAYHLESGIPSHSSTFDQRVEETLQKLRYQKEDGKPVQSENDNSAGFDEMISALNPHFQKICLEEGHGFFYELIGGLRMGSSEKNREMAHFIKMADKLFCTLGMIPAANFIYAGRKRNDR